MTNTTIHNITNATFAPTYSPSVAEGVLEFAFQNITANVNITELPEDVVEEAEQEVSKFIGYYTLESLPFIICEANVNSSYDSDGIYLFWVIFSVLFDSQYYIRQIMLHNSEGTSSSPHKMY